ncbi:hypothetical protein SteCoe_35337 [Stentor coeruleus]|uniref:Uncharacterized protein n=1 Tax=Stentor coeruleus TaxID=5963 RepID=A0A1R2ASQ2_9CILI|nr:hypothetical protein SteCoe_35337 [Stentor coeruleus]
MKFSRLEFTVPKNLEGVQHNDWKDRVNQETSSYFQSIDRGLISHKLLPNTLEGIAHPNLSTIRTSSYARVDNFFEKRILEKSSSDILTNKEISKKRYNNYPWAASSIQIEHDFSKKSVNSPKYKHIIKLRNLEAQRQNNVSKNLFQGQSSRPLHIKLPPINKQN